jgi:hypothetical protein
MVNASGSKRAKGNRYFTMYLWLISVIIALPMLTAMLNSYVSNEYRERLPITHGLKDYVQALNDTAPPIINMSVVTGIVGVIVTLCVLACMVISFRYPPGIKNNKALVWIGVLTVGLAALMAIDFIDELAHSYPINSFSDETNGFLLDNLAVALYYILIPTVVVLGLIFVTTNFVRKIQFAQKKK